MNNGLQQLDPNDVRIFIGAVKIPRTEYRERLAQAISTQVAFDRLTPSFRRIN